MTRTPGRQQTVQGKWEWEREQSRTMTNSRSKQTKLIQSRFLRIYCYIFVGSLMSYIRAICARSGNSKKQQEEEEEEDMKMGMATLPATETETRSQIKAGNQSQCPSQATFAASLQLRAGICIIRLITLKRFLKILAMPTDNNTKNNNKSSSSNSRSSSNNQQLQLERCGSRGRCRRSHSSWRRSCHSSSVCSHSRHRTSHSRTCHSSSNSSHNRSRTCHSRSSSSHSRSSSTRSTFHGNMWSSSSSQYLLLLLLLLLSCHWPQCEAMHGGAKASNSTVKTKYGILRGIVVRTAPLVEAFLGIPYASPPVGSLR